MRSLLLAVVLVVILAVPVFAVQSGTLSFTLNHPLSALSATSFNATIGGVQGVITTTAGGAWVMTVAGHTFASGAYACNGSCTFHGTMLSGKSLSFSLGNTSGTLPGLFTTHGAWVSTVAGWANGHLSGRNRGDVVSEAAGAKAQAPAQELTAGEHAGGKGHK